MVRSFLYALALSCFPAAAALAQIASFTCPIAGPANACGNPEFQACSIDVTDSAGVAVTRDFCIHVPAQPAEGMSAIWGFHGGGGNTRVGVGLMDSETEQGAILVAPSAIPSGSNCNTAWRSFGETDFDEWSEIDSANDPCAAATQDNDADLDFVLALMDEIDAQLSPESHFAWGFSSGASMSYQLMITAPLSQRFAGFGMIGAAMNEAKLAAAAGGAGIDWSAETEIAHPVLVSRGSNDRVFFPTQLIIERVNALAAGAWPAGHPCALVNTPETVLRCWREQPMLPGQGKHYWEDQGDRTLRFLLARNRPAQRALEGLYPDLGHGRDSTLRQEDQTVTVRREWPATRRSGSQPVVWLDVIGAQHVVPAARGNYPPCASAACDVDAFRTLLQFWRANAGLFTRWR